MAYNLRRAEVRRITTKCLVTFALRVILVVEYSLNNSQMVLSFASEVENSEI